MPPKKAEPAPAAAAAPVEEVKVDEGPPIDTARKDRVRAAFRICDPEDTGAVDAEKVPMIMRYLRLYVTDKDFVEKVLPDMRGPDGE